MNYSTNKRGWLAWTKVDVDNYQSGADLRIWHVSHGCWQLRVKNEPWAEYGTFGEAKAYADEMLAREYFEEEEGEESQGCGNQNLRTKSR